MIRYDEIREFSSDEIDRMASEIVRIQNVISSKQSDLDSVKWNPANYLIESQRDAMTRMENGIVQDQHVLQQLKDTSGETVASNDTDKLARWFDLAAVVGDASDLAIWRSQKQFAQTSEMVKTVASETAQQIKNPFGLDWKVWVGGAVLLALILKLGRK